MATGTPSSPDAPSAHRRRDAASTRQLLLAAARRRFTVDGYAGTTVREIADDAGVNVALINRYFTSKEGLFGACLAGAVDEFGRAVAKDLVLDQVPEAIARQLAGQGAGQGAGPQPNHLLMLLRSSGDERAEQIRLDVLRSFAERLAAAAGWHPGAPDADRLMLNAQITLSAAFGIALLRATTAMEPLSTAGEQDLVGPLRSLLHALLPPDRA